MPSPRLAAIVQLLRSTEFKEKLADDVDRARETLKATALQGVPAAMEYRLAHGITCEDVDVSGVPGEWISPPVPANAPAILFLHGGGYVAGSIKPTGELACRIAQEAGARVLSLEYALAPENPYPRALEDAVKAYRWLVSQGLKPHRLVICGLSAGGGLALATLVAVRDAGDPMPAAAVCLSPMTDLACTGESIVTKAEIDPAVSADGLRHWAKWYLGDVDPRTPLASPLYADLRGLPPLLIQVGSAEVLLDDSTGLAAKARAAGVDVTLEVWEDMIHGWPLFARILPEGQQAIERIGEYVRRHAE